MLLVDLEVSKPYVGIDLGLWKDMDIFNQIYLKNDCCDWLWKWTRFNLEVFIETKNPWKI